MKVNKIRYIRNATKEKKRQFAININCRGVYGRGVPYNTIDHRLSGIYLITDSGQVKDCVYQKPTTG